MKILGVIPARFGSTRFPGKPLFEIAGKPLLRWVLDGASQSKRLSGVIVATDDERIAAVARNAGVEAVMTDSALASGTDRVWAAVKNRQADAVLNIQGDEPLITGELIDLLASGFDDASVEMSTLAHPIAAQELASLNAVKVLVNQQGNAIYFSRFPIPYSRRDATEFAQDGSLKHIGLYGFRKDFLEKFCSAPEALIEKAESLEQLRALDLGARIRVFRVDQGLQGVDTPEDAAKVAQILKLRG